MNPLTRSRIRSLLVVLALLFGTVAHGYEELWQSPGGRERIFNALVDIFKENYWNPEHEDWDRWALSFHDRAVAAESRADFDSALRSMVNALGDDHSRWVGLASGSIETPESARSPGLGFQHSFLVGQGLVVERVYPQTPAAAAGLQRGDLVLRVNGSELRDLPSAFELDSVLREAIQSGSVQLGLRRRGAFLNLRLEPAPVDFARLSELPQADMLDASTGYLYLPSFRNEGTAESVNDLLSELQARGATSLVLDLRDNLGGRLGELGLVLGAFIEGPWVEAVSGDAVIWRSSYERELDLGLNLLETAEGEDFARDSLELPVRFAGPLAVLVSRQNSSAGEIAPLVLQDLGRATILGEPTRGNVEAIQAFDLPDGSVVYVAVANLRGVSGRDFSQGLVPDIVVSESLSELARGFDAPLAEALRAVKSLPFTPGKVF